MAELDIDPILQTRKPTDLPEPVTQAVRGGLQILGEEAEHIFGLPQAIMEQSELLRTTGEYNPAPTVELLSLGVGGGMGAAEKDALGVFGGRAWARDVDFLADPKARKFVPPGSSLARERKYRPAFDAAQLMEQAGKSREEIFDETGWFRGHEGKWRFEISDKGAELIPIDPTNRFNFDKLSDVLHHPKLFEQYPDLANMRLKWDAPSRSASYSPYSDTGYLADEHISLNPKDPDLLTRILHEVQHAVQAREGFSPGGNPEEWKLVHEAMKAHQKYPESSLPMDLAYESYKRHAGEVEARNVQYRRLFGDIFEQDRKEGRPWETEDRPASKMIHREPHQRPPRIRLTPVEGDPFAAAKAETSLSTPKQPFVPLHMRPQQPGQQQPRPIVPLRKQPQLPQQPRGTDPRTFAERVNHIASQLKTPPFQGRVAIADVYDRYGHEFPDAGSLASFKERVLNEAKGQKLFVSRLDMPEYMDKEKRVRSETPYGQLGDTVHFITEPPDWSGIRWKKR